MSLYVCVRVSDLVSLCMCGVSDLVSFYVCVGVSDLVSLCVCVE